MGNGKKSAQSGFTLIEVMIVAAVIGILTSIVMPEIRSYQARAKVSEAMLAARAAAATSSTRVYLSGNEPSRGRQLGLRGHQPVALRRGVDTDDAGAGQPRRWATRSATCAFRCSTSRSRRSNGSGSVMREEDLGTPIRRWRCGSPIDGTDLNPTYLPGTCRG